MEKGNVVFYVVVGSLGLVSAILAFAGEGTKIKSSDVEMLGNVCDYPKSPAAGFGYISVLLLIIAQIIINVFNGCFCCKRHQHSNSSNRSIALLCFIFSWVTFVFAFFMLMLASGANSLRNNPGYFDYCYIVKPGVFSGAAVLVLATVALGITCHVLISLSKNSGPWGQHQNPGIAMAQPQFLPANNQPGSWAPANPQQNQNYSSNSDPVFVHEDTYRRQQVP